ncbi:hypothetical protein ACUNV4_11260 [Granulosicoccus sp. 3-233]|uniref:hypothetical protein n=1 Tax=Granulosicoccus sp. 3-233 TaxID=3417969 RepID=UPI003D3255C8
MTFSALYLLPALAFVILLQGSLVTVRGNLQYRSRRFQRRIRSRVLFFRALVVSLLVATAITRFWPLPGLPSLVQGVLIATALMIPFAIYALYVRLTSGSSKQSHADDERHEHSAETKDTTTEATGDLPGREKTLQDNNAMAATSLHSQESESNESALDQTLSVGEQLETLDELVDFHDIGNEEYSSNSGSSPGEAFNPLEKAIAIAREGILEEPAIRDYSRENLPARSSAELAEMVVRLRSDKMKLQKLVIAQKAVIDAEKQAHDRTKVVVKDAISVMRHARHGQRIAEKIARRERAERQRLEKDLDKVKRQLDNALSTLPTAPRTEVEEA